MTITNPRISGATFIYPGKSLDEGLAVAANHDFRTVDVGVGGRNGHLSPRDVAGDPQRFAAQVREAVERRGMTVNECFTLNFGPPINVPDAAVRKETTRLFTGLSEFAHTAGFRSLMLIPGPIHPQLGQQRSLDLAVETLKPLVEIARAREMHLHIEADCDSCARTPAAAEELCSRVHGLRLSLDYSHFIHLGHAQREVEPLHRFAGHVHVRQAAQGRIVEFVEEGVIDYARVITDLERREYQGLFMVEYLSCGETDQCGVDVAVETPKMIATLEGLLSATSSDHHQNKT